MSLIDSCKRKLDAYTRDDDGVSSSSSVRTRIDDINSVSRARSTACSAESSKSNSSLQTFLVRLFSGNKTLVIRADVNDTIEYILDFIQSKAGISSNVHLLIYKSKQLYPELTYHGDT